MAKELKRLQSNVLKAGGAKKRPIRKPLLPLQPATDPIVGVVDYTGDVESDAKQELDAIQSGFRDRLKGEADRFKVATGSNYCFCVVFDDGDQADAFLNAVGVGKSESDLFVDGRKLADRLGIAIPESKLVLGRKFKVDGKLAKYATIPK